MSTQQTNELVHWLSVADMRIVVLEKALKQCLLWAHNTEKVVEIADAALNARDNLKLADGAIKEIP